MFDPFARLIVTALLSASQFRFTAVDTERGKHMKKLTTQQKRKVASKARAKYDPAPLAEALSKNNVFLTDMGLSHWATGGSASGMVNCNGDGSFTVGGLLGTSNALNDIERRDKEIEVLTKKVDELQDETLDLYRRLHRRDDFYLDATGGR